MRRSGLRTLPTPPLETRPCFSWTRLLLLLAVLGGLHHALSRRTPADATSAHSSPDKLAFQAAGARALPAASRAIRPARPVILLTASWCGYCRKQRADLNAAGLPHVEYDVETDRMGQRLYDTLPKPHGIPVIIVGDEWLVGYHDDLGAHLLRLNPQLRRS